MKKIFICMLAILPLMCLAQRTETLLDKQWKFFLGDDPKFAEPDCQTDNWQSLTIPHDWAIFGPFSSQNDQQTVAILQDGQIDPLEHAGRTGGLPFVGTGWYRRTISIDDEHFDHKKAFIVFDGAMSEPQVFINGKKAGEWKYGYNSFIIDATNFLQKGDNLLAVRLQNLPESSRWYPGAGLYRNVRLIITNRAHIPIWGQFITTPIVNKNFAQIKIDTEITYPRGIDPMSLRIQHELIDENGDILQATVSSLSPFEPHIFHSEIHAYDPKLWSPDKPALYTLKTTLLRDDIKLDCISQRVGIRKIELIPEKGFFLNGERTIFKGVCLHHDLGPLGTAVNEAAIRRQIRILKDMGCNAIRTSHNMPAPELVRACDEMGMMLMAESFDEWQIPKCKNGYNRFFNDWAEKDLTNLIRQFRNSPSIMMWCIGNEVPNQGILGECKTARFLQDICHKLDPTRPVTQGMDNPDAVVNNNFAAVMDIPGFNYRSHKFEENYSKLPQGFILGAETSSALSSRGVYKFPVERKKMAKYDDHQASSYDVEHVGWGTLPDDEFIQYEFLPYNMGEFVWTGFDYLGEPTPYYTNWPSHSSLFGIVDLAGIPKDRYYLYRSFWNKNDQTLHVLPHWTFPERKNQITPVFVYTSYPEAEVFINGVSQGRRKKDESITLANTKTPESADSLTRLKRYRLMWMDTKYVPGTLKVVAYNSDGSVAETKEIHTASKPHHIELIPDRSEITADGKDLSFIRLRVVDKDGNLCPNAENLISFKVKGQGTFRAATAGKTTSLEPFHEPNHKVFSGELTAIVQSSNAAGNITFTAASKGIKSASCSIKTVSQ